MKQEVINEKLKEQESEPLDYVETKIKKKKKMTEKQIQTGINNLKKYHENRKIEKKVNEMMSQKQSQPIEQPIIKTMKIDSDDEIDIDEIINKKLTKKQSQNQNLDMMQGLSKNDIKQLLKEEMESKLNDIRDKIDLVTQRTEKMYQMKKMKAQINKPKNEIQPIIIEGIKNNDSNNKKLLELLRNNVIRQ